MIQEGKKPPTGRGEVMKKKTIKSTTTTVKVDKSGFYTKLIIFKAGRASLWTSSTLLLVVYGVMMYRHLYVQAEHWSVLVLPITFFGLLTILLPPAEEWEYKAWQNAAQQYEHYFFD